MAAPSPQVLYKMYRPSLRCQPEKVSPATQRCCATLSISEQGSLLQEGFGRSQKFCSKCLFRKDTFKSTDSKSHRYTPSKDIIPQFLLSLHAEKTSFFRKRSSILYSTQTRGQQSPELANKKWRQVKHSFTMSLLCACRLLVGDLTECTEMDIKSGYRSYC